MSTASRGDKIRAINRKLGDLEALIRSSDAASAIRPGCWLGAYIMLDRVADNLDELDRRAAEIAREAA